MKTTEKAFYFLFNYSDPKHKGYKAEYSGDVLKKISEMLHRSDANKYPHGTNSNQFNFGRIEPYGDLNLKIKHWLNDTFVVKAFIPTQFAKAIREIHPRFIIK